LQKEAILTRHHAIGGSPASLEEEHAARAFGSIFVDIAIHWAGVEKNGRTRTRFGRCHQRARRKKRAVARAR
jgi:hypothetical protein